MRRMRKTVAINTRLLAFVLMLSAFLLFSNSAPGQRRNTTPASSQVRSVTVVSEPNAVVWIDGVRYGITDSAGKLAVRNLASRSHVVRVRADGFKEVSKTFPATHKTDYAVPLTVRADEAELAYQEAEKLSTQDREKAVAAYNNALKLRPRYPEALIGLARIYSETGDHEKAEKAVRDARRLRPGYAEASAIEGRIQKDSGDEEKAIAIFKRAVAEGKGFQPEAYTGLGLLFKERAEAAASNADYEAETENYKEAAKYLSTAVTQLGSSPDAMVIAQILGLIHERQKNYKEAIGVYEELLRNFPDSSESTAVRSFIDQIRKQMNPLK